MSEFDRRPLCELADCRMGETILSKDLDRAGYPIFSADSSAGAWGHKKQISKILKRGSIVIGARGTIGNPRLPNYDEFGCTQTTIAVTPSSEVDPYYLRLALESSDIKGIAAQQAVPMLTIGQVSQLEIAVPPLTEQRKIAEILSGIDDQISNNLEKKRKCESIQKSYVNIFLEKIFSGGSDCEIKPLGSIADVRGRIGWKGYTKEDLVDSGVLVLGGTQISRSNEIDLSKPVYISDFKYEESPEIMVIPGDLILVKTGNTIGKIALVPDWDRRATINPNTAILRTKSNLSRYLLLLLSSDIYQRKLWDLVAVGAQPSINQANLKALELPLISKEEMNLLCDNIYGVANTAKLYGKKIAMLRHLKQAVSSDLLSGRKRVSV